MFPAFFASAVEFMNEEKLRTLIVSCGLYLSKSVVRRIRRVVCGSIEGVPDGAEDAGFRGRGVLVG